MYIFNDKALLSEWMKCSYSGIMLKSRTRKSPYIKVCSCGFNENTDNPDSVCPKCGKNLYVSNLRKDDISDKSMNLGFKYVLTPMPHSYEQGIGFSRLIIKALKNSSGDIEINLSEDIEVQIIYNSLEDVFFSAIPVPSSLDVVNYWQVLNLSKTSFGEIRKTLSSKTLNIISVILGNYVNIENGISQLPFYSKEIKDFPLVFTEENVKKYPELLRFFLTKNGKKAFHTFTFPSKVTVEDLFSRVGLKKTAMPYAQLIPFCRYNYSNCIALFNMLASDEIPYSKYFLELLSREIISCDIMLDIVAFYNDIHNGKKINKSYSSIKTNEIEYFDGILDNSMAEIFINFVKKNINLDMRYPNEFIERYQNLCELGEMPTEDNICREYNRIVNRSRFSFAKIDNLEDVFKKDPLEALKYMK